MSVLTNGDTEVYSISMIAIPLCPLLTACEDPSTYSLIVFVCVNRGCRLQRYNRVFSLLISSQMRVDMSFQGIIV